MTQEQPVKCRTKYSGPTDPIVKVCGWEGFAAFFMEDKHSFGNEYYRSLVFKPLPPSSEEEALIRIRDDAAASMSEHCKNSGCHIMTDEKGEAVDIRIPVSTDHE